MGGTREVPKSPTGVSSFSLIGKVLIPEGLEKGISFNLRDVLTLFRKLQNIILSNLG